MEPSTQLTPLQIKELRKLFEQMEKGHDPQDVLLDNADLQRRFHICRRTAYTWRKKNLIKHLLVRRKVFYRLSDVRAFLETQMMK